MCKDTVDHLLLLRWFRQGGVMEGLPGQYRIFNATKRMFLNL